MDNYKIWVKMTHFLIFLLNHKEFFDLLINSFIINIYFMDKHVPSINMQKMKHIPFLHKK